MDPAQKTALRKSRVHLVNHLEMRHLYDYILKDELLTPIMVETIQAKECRPDQVRAFLDILPRRGPTAYNIFLKILTESGQNALANHIKQEYDRETGNASGLSELSLTPESSSDNEDMEGVEVFKGTSLITAVQETGSPVANLPDPQSIVSLTSQGSSASLGPGYTGNYEEEYRMESSPRGFLLIINNRTFRGDLEERMGTDVDCANLKCLFLSLGFGVELRTNLTAEEIIANLEVLSRHEQLPSVDCLVVAILTHGSDDYLYGVDEMFVDVNHLYEKLSATQCPALIHKPKFFIVNACRGDAEDKGILATPSIGRCSVGVDVNKIPDTAQAVRRIANMQDFLIAYSTIPRHVSWRHKTEGSFFVQGFVKVFKEWASTMDVVSMLVKVNHHVSRIDEYAGIQIPSPQVMLTKKWYLNPPNAANSS